MLAVTLFAVTHGYFLPQTELTSILDDYSITVSLENNESGNKSGEDDFKPPKHSFIDYSIFFSGHYIIPAYNPAVSKLLSHEPFQAVPQVYLEINVPPDSLA
ncbi:MAG: hypothetical protein H7X83_02735 [Verrucomicrobia bacterium]|nr:hypothetical protein [Deltaproteobacteria bacterium]